MRVAEELEPPSTASAAVARAAVEGQALQLTAVVLVDAEQAADLRRERRRRRRERAGRSAVAGGDGRRAGARLGHFLSARGAWVR